MFETYRLVELGNYANSEEIVTDIVARSGRGFDWLERAWLLAFRPNATHEQVNIVKVTPRQLGLRGERTREDIRFAAKGRGLVECPDETVVALLRPDVSAPVGRLAIRVMLRTIEVSRRVQQRQCVVFIVDGRVSLSLLNVDSGHLYPEDGEWAFLKVEDKW